jgi:hypothetical protein
MRVRDKNSIFGMVSVEECRLEPLFHNSGNRPIRMHFMALFIFGMSGIGEEKNAKYGHLATPGGVCGRWERSKT